MKILFIGDIVGSPGRRAVKELLPKLRQAHGLDVIIANGENSAGGNGITPDIAEELFGYGVDAITTGDHLWDQKEVMELLQNEKRFLRPLNYPPGTPGKGSTILKIRDLPPIAVMNVQGRTFMQPPLDNPFTLALDEAKVPVTELVRGACEILGLDPMYVANEGRFICLLPAAQAEQALEILARAAPGGPPALIGTVKAGPAGEVTLRSVIGAERIVDRLSGEQLPRIC